MKPLIILLTIFFISCSRNKETIVVQYVASSGAELLSSPVFDHIEVLILHGEGAPLLGNINMIVKNDTYYIEDQRLSKIHLFDATGKYLHSVGERGRGPSEYLSFGSMIVEESGDISIFSSQQKSLFTYSSQGDFLGSTKYPHGGYFNKMNGFNYHYYGHGSGMPYQLYIVDGQEHVIDSCLVSFNVVNVEDAPFSAFGDALNLTPYYGGDVYRLFDGKVSIAYKFDFGAYNIPDKYFTFSDMFEAFDFLLPKTHASKHRFFENQKYAILQAIIGNMEQEWGRAIYGLLEKATSTWSWYYMQDGDFMNSYCLKYMDDSYVYFTAEPELMKQTPGMIQRFPLLNTLTDNDNIVILRCKMASANL